MTTNPPKTILIVDDAIVNLEILSDLLHDYDLIEATRGQEALSLLETESVDLILLDILMPDMDGFELCRHLQQNPKTQDIPVIFMTASEEEHYIEKAFEVGGRDYITKPIKPKELLARVQMQLKLQQLQAELKHLACTDYLTGLYNRRYFMTIAHQLIKLAKRTRHPLSLMMLDIDYFKRINDTYGHHAGDLVIETLADTLKQNIRESDVAARFGGEEFIILLPNTAKAHALTLAENLRQRVEDLIIEDKEQDQVLTLTISIGVSEIDHSAPQALENAIQQADENLYRAKKAGRNQVIGPSEETP